MRVLILSVALVACVSGAPTVLQPLVAFPAAIPTIAPGDLEAAAINAKVYVEDKTQEAIDKARLLTDLAKENTEEKVVEITDLAKEKNAEAFWSVEDKKWQALDALKTYEAKLDGAIANNAEAIAKSSVGIVPTYIAPIGTPLSPLSPITYIASEIKTEEMKEEKKEEEKKEELVKSAEPEKEVKVEKVELKTELKPQAVAPVFSPLTLAPGLKLSDAWLAPMACTPAGCVPTYGAYATPLFAPTLLKAPWEIKQ